MRVLPCQKITRWKSATFWARVAFNRVTWLWPIYFCIAAVQSHRGGSRILREFFSSGFEIFWLRPFPPNTGSAPSFDILMQFPITFLPLVWGFVLRLFFCTDLINIFDSSTINALCFKLSGVWHRSDTCLHIFKDLEWACGDLQSINLPKSFKVARNINCNAYISIHVRSCYRQFISQ